MRVNLHLEGKYRIIVASFKFLDPIVKYNRTHSLKYFLYFEIFRHLTIITTE